MKAGMIEINMELEVQKYLRELIKRNAINRDVTSDLMFISYLNDCKIDMDYVKLSEAMQIAGIRR